MQNDQALVRLCDGIDQLIKKLETLERCVSKLTDCVNDLTVVLETVPLLDDSEVIEAEADHIDLPPTDPAKRH